MYWTYYTPIILIINFDFQIFSLYNYNSKIFSPQLGDVCDVSMCAILWYYVVLSMVILTYELTGWAARDSLTDCCIYQVPASHPEYFTIVQSTVSCTTLRHVLSTN